MRFHARRVSGLLLSWLAATALPAADRASATDPDPAAAQARAQQLAADDRPREALAIYESLAESYPDNAEYLTALGRLQMRLNRALAASWTLQDAIAADPDHEQAYRLLKQAYYAAGQSERAYGILQQARQRFGERPWMNDGDG